MSGGVDSSVTALVLKEKGHQVLGLSLRLGHGADAGWRKGAEAAEQLGIGHEVVDAQKAFEDKVISPVAHSYASGLTPNPCALCNAAVKLPLLWAAAKARGCVALATGHYARLEGQGPAFRLKEAVCREKSQAYFLSRVPVELLRHVWFPLGGMEKDQVRDLAQRAGLEAAQHKESQDVCFLPPGGWDELMARFGLIRPGPLEDSQGRELGRHDGLHRFTVGQRRGLGVALGHPAYVLALDGERAAVRVGTQEELWARGLWAQDPHWYEKPYEKTHEIDGLMVRIRYAHPGVGCEVRGEGSRVKVIFDRPQRAVAPGQLAVFQRGETVLGSAWIMRSI